jgi:methyl-accepting chemotaxis protein
MTSTLTPGKTPFMREGGRMRTTQKLRVHITGLFIVVCIAGAIVGVGFTLMMIDSIAERNVQLLADEIERVAAQWKQSQNVRASLLAESLSRSGGDVRPIRAMAAELDSATSIMVTDGRGRVLYNAGVITPGELIGKGERPVPDHMLRIVKAWEHAGKTGHVTLDVPIANLGTLIAVERPHVQSWESRSCLAVGSLILGDVLPEGISPLDTGSHEATDGTRWLVAGTGGPWRAVACVRESDALSARGWILASVAIAILIGAFGVYMFVSVVTGRLETATEEAGEVVSAIMKGDFTHSIAESGDDDLAELCMNINQLTSSLATSIDEIEKSSQAVAASAQQILATSEEHETATNQQSSALHQTVGTIEEMDISASQAAENAQEVVGRTEGAADQIRTLSDKAQRIGKVTEVIADVSQQIRILALSASIEAARASNSVGFSLIAEEIRRLADDTSRSTADIDALVQGMQESASHSVRAMEQTVDAVKAIGMAMSQQSIATGQITEAMAEMNAGMSEAVLFTRASVDAGEELNMMAARLQETIVKLRNPELIVLEPAGTGSEEIPAERVHIESAEITSGGAGDDNSEY